MSESAHSSAKRRSYGTAEGYEKLIAASIKKAIRVRTVYLDEHICTLCHKREVGPRSCHCIECQKRH